MRTLVSVLLLAVYALPLSACAQDATVRVGGVEFVRQSVTVGAGQKEATAADVDRDGRPEWLLAGNDSLTVLRGGEDGTVIVQGRVPAGSSPTGPDAADLDGDGHLDVAIANHNTPYVTLLRGDGGGGFRPFPDSPLTVDVDPHPHAVRAADLDADGHADLVIDHRGAEGLLILRGTGDGTFESSGTVVPVGGDPYRGMAVGDLNGDSALDLVTPNPDGVGVLIGDNPGELAFTRDALATQAGPFAVALADVNADGALDVIAALDEGASHVQVFLGDGQGAFREAAESPFDLAPGGKQIATGDVNGDGAADAVIVGWNASEVLILLGGAPSIRAVRLPDAENSWGPAVADLNGDGADDLLIPDAASDQAILYMSRRE